MLTSIFKPLYYKNDAQFLTNRHLMETQNLVISSDYSWFLAKNLAYAYRIMKFHYWNSSIMRKHEKNRNVVFLKRKYIYLISSITDCNEEVSNWRSFYPLAAKYKRNFDSFCTFMAESIICQLAVSDSSQKISVNFLATFKAFSQFTNPNTQA